MDVVSSAVDIKLSSKGGTFSSFSCVLLSLQTSWHCSTGAVKAALKLPSKTQGLVNCWISDIRECRNQHHAELKALKEDEQIDRLCELNVMRQTFHICTSPVVQNAWDQGQELAVYGVIYSLRDGL